MEQRVQIEIAHLQTRSVSKTFTSQWGR